ncbi:DUF4198 domain-containing protein [Neisseria meningitidis]|nr:DUF4198 domain-containing protein [Neisseria meningitidis]MCL6032594.1 DUF4198 domain-containing protein [Neisseria meningitidis]MCL6036784.1 DUF4198 domain-containing protein [Neisseria meningitidis]MCL6067413.1 DUF4198 domain-containing protein [Neisseria meningitidis]MCL6073234.1 DUF4198 domain-containing protein [Neisseria meningitidis]
MKKTLTLLAVSALFAASAHAHRVWVETAHTHGGEYLKADLGYGEFPELEPIAKDRLHIFSKPMQLVTEKGKENMIQRGTYNYQYRSNRPVKDGSYLVIAEYQPTFWSKNKAGWKQAGIKEMPDASYCEQTRMFGKNIVNVGHESADTAIITKPFGQNLEIVPLDNPANIHVGERFKVRVLFRGEPLPNATVTATFDGFDTSDRSKTHKTEAQAFSDSTDDKGEVDIIPLRQGFWKANVEHKADFPNQSVCQKQANYSTLTFQIGHSHH